MKNTVWLVWLVMLTALAVSGTAEGAEAGLPGGQSGYPINLSTVDLNQLEGWIIGVNYRDNSFRLLDPRGFQRRIVTKPGTIGDYRIGDRVRVEIDPDYKRARVIEKLY